MNPVSFSAFGPDGSELERLKSQPQRADKAPWSKYDRRETPVRQGKGAKAFGCRLLVHPSVRGCGPSPRYLSTGREPDAFTARRFSGGFRSCRQAHSSS